ncbi:MAG: DUF2116 family Zn-ribbon domain-containing protein [archaeon]|nr:DUF2116 family Zn-ribbon domain-containing protein [archaeon]
MSLNMPEHDHCRWCGDAIPFDMAYCSMDCYEKDQARIKKEKNLDRAITSLAAVGVIAILAIGLIF